MLISRSPITGDGGSIPSVIASDRGGCGGGGVGGQRTILAETLALEAICLFGWILRPSDVSRPGTDL